jgi:hypothetical protein
MTKVEALTLLENQVNRADRSYRMALTSLIKASKGCREQIAEKVVDQELLDDLQLASTAMLIEAMNFIMSHPEYIEIENQYLPDIKVHELMQFAKNIRQLTSVQNDAELIIG